MAGIQDIYDEYRDADVRVVALSADGREGAREMEEDEGLDFPVLYGLDCKDVRDRFGIYIEKRTEKTHLQPAQFILDPDGTVRLASYSSGKVGRLDAREALDEIEDLRS